MNSSESMEQRNDLGYLSIQEYIMSDAIKKAEGFLTREKAFRLGELLTEAFHPKTKTLSQTAAVALPAAIRMLQAVDDEIPPAMEKVLKQDSFERLVNAFDEAMNSLAAVLA
jgi:hypothetical protein